MFCHIPRFVANAIELIFLDRGAAHTHRVSQSVGERIISCGARIGGKLSNS